MKDRFNFKNKTLKEIHAWAWLASVLPITALAGLFFIWALGSDTWLQIAMVVGATSMFVIAVAWWWWALYVFRTLIQHWDYTKDNVAQVSKELKEIKNIFREIFFNRSDK
jgi:hypothetical protein